MTRDKWLEENIDFLRYLVHKYKGLNADEEFDHLLGMAFLSLNKAWKNYDSEKGVAFNTYLHRVYLNDARQLARKRSSPTESLNRNALSLDVVYDDDSDHNNPILETMATEDEPDMADVLAQEMDAHDMTVRIRRVLSDKELEVFELMLKGYSQGKLANILGCSQPTVNYYIRKIRKKAKMLWRS